MIVCVCQRVSHRDIARAVAEGAQSFDEVQLATGAATCCGCCETCTRETLEEALADHHGGRKTIPIHHKAAALA